MNNSYLFLYQEGNTLVHRLSVGKKLSVLLIISIFLMLIDNRGIFLKTATFIIIFLSTFYFYRLSKISLKGTVINTRYILLFLLFFYGIPIWFYIIKVLFLSSTYNYFFFKNTVIGTVYSALGVCILIFLSLLFTYTTKVADIVDFLLSFFTPLKKIGFPINTISVAIGISIRLIPTAHILIEDIIAAQASRGSKNNVTSVFYWLPSFIIKWFSKADALSDAIDARGGIIDD